MYLVLLLRILRVIEYKCCCIACSIRKHEKYICKLQEVWLSICFKDLPFQFYITYRIWAANIPTHSVKFPHLSELTLNSKTTIENNNTKGCVTNNAMTRKPINSFEESNISALTASNKQKHVQETYHTSPTGKACKWGWAPRNRLPSLKLFEIVFIPST